MTRAPHARRVAGVWLFCAALVATAPVAPAAAVPVTPAATAATAARRATPPIVFEANEGRTDDRVRYVARGRGYRLFLTPDEAVLSLAPHPESAAATSSPVPRAAAGRAAAGRAAAGRAAAARHAVRLRFAGTAGAAHVAGLEPLAAKVHSFVGDRSRWRTNVETFARVRYEGLYPGVDAVFYGRDGELEYDFVVAPGADPSAIALEVEGADRVSVDAAGDLLVETPAGTLRQRRPVAYQQRGAARALVPARYEVRGARVSVAVGAHDPSLPLVVDPVLVYSTYVAGSGDDSGAGVAVDASGGVYVVGGTASLDFPTTAGAYSTESSGLTDGFVAKLAPDGAGYVFSTYLGGSGDEGIARAVLDAAGNVYVAGGTGSTDWPTTPGAYDATANGGFDAFVAKLSPDGSALLFSTYVGGSGDDGFSGLALDASNAVYLTGGSTSSNFPTSADAFDRDNASLLGFPDAVVSKLSADGSSLVYSTYLGAGFNLEAGAAIAVDASGNAVVAGATNGGFPTTSGAFDTSYNGGAFDGFVTKLNASASGLLFSTYLGGSGEDYVFGLATNGSGDLFLTGYTDSTSFPTAGAFQPTNAGGFDAFVTRLAASGASLVHSSYLGGSGDEGLTSNLGTELQIAGAIAVDASGAAYVTGFTDSTDFPVAGAWQRANGGGFDAWVAKVAPGGGSKEYASYLGGAADERGLGIAVDAAGNAYVTGFTVSTNFPTTAGVVRPAGFANLLGEGFVAKVGAGPGDTAGVYVEATGAWFLRTSNSPGGAAAVFTYGGGGAGVVPLAGDWDGNSTVTAGLYVEATGAFFLRNSNSPGGADLVFTFGGGGPGIVPVAGDWDGDGRDTVGIYVVATGVFFLRDENSSGPADLAFGFGGGGGDIVPLAGDWDGDGDDTVGLYNRATGFFFLTNENASGGADLVFGFGPASAGIVPLAGDWNGDGVDTVGVYVEATGAWFLRDSNASGPADVVFAYGPPAATPLVGHWGG